MGAEEMCVYCKSWQRVHRKTQLLRAGASASGSAAPAGPSEAAALPDAQAVVRAGGICVSTVGAASTIASISVRPRARAASTRPPVAASDDRPRWWPGVAVISRRPPIDADRRAE
jgi:hypothetical protein